MRVRINNETKALLYATGEMIWWFDASDASTFTLDGTKVAQWRDKSPNQFHAAQATSTLRPEYVANAVNGLSVVRMGPSTKTLMVIDTNGFSINDCALYAVVKPTSANGTVYEANNGVTTWNIPKRLALHFYAPDVYPSYYGAQTLGSGVAMQGLAAGTNSVFAIETNVNYLAPTAVYNTAVSTHTVIGLERANTTASLYLNGTLVRTGLPSGNAASPTVMTHTVITGIGIGGSYEVTSAWYTGDICELIMYSARHDAAQRAAITSQLMTKWGIT